MCSKRLLLFLRRQTKHLIYFSHTTVVSELMVLLKEQLCESRQPYETALLCFISWASIMPNLTAFISEMNAKSGHAAL